MISNSVAERSREFGIRLALGATVSRTIRNCATSGLICAVIGLTIGLLVARMGTRFLQGMLYGIMPVDHVTYLSVGVGVLAIAAVASLVPSAENCQT
jgi:putative ABC transport system permease protein